MLFPEGSLFLAPMEGVTDDIYRYTVEKAFGGWDYYACDFLRIPSAGEYSSKHILKHYGKRSFQTDYLREKTYYQILASDKSFIEKTVEKISDIGFDWLDLNLGCPSKTVCKNKGGSFLLSDISLLESVVLRVRKNFKGHFTAKIRLGFHDDHSFLEIIKCLEACGVEAITIHGRTREQLYKGVADWKPIAKAVQEVDIPIIGNGDVWTTKDIQAIKNQTGCHGVMIARGAMKSPWLARDYKSAKTSNLVGNIDLFIQTFLEQLQLHEIEDKGILKRFKGLSRYMFEDLDQGEKLKTSLLRSEDLSQFMNIWINYRGKPSSTRDQYI